NGKIERPHWDVRQSLFKACDGDMRKWAKMLIPVFWAERITTRKRMGCSPYFAVTGSHPVLALDIVQATWLVEPPAGFWSTEELIGIRAKQLGLHAIEVEKLIKRVDQEKRRRTLRYLEANQATIRSWDFPPGTLVLVRNTAIEKALNKKAKPRFLGPCIVIRRTLGGAYVMAEMDGSVIANKIAAFRVYPYAARRKVKLPSNLEELTGLSAKELDRVVNGPEPDDTPPVEIQTDGVVTELAGEESGESSWPLTLGDDDEQVGSDSDH
ncbi:hypothetical protein K435DRAFT_655523, partial [Dendrothele bispora CBS 962.96]